MCLLCVVCFVVFCFVLFCGLLLVVGFCVFGFVCGLRCAVWGLRFAVCFALLCMVAIWAVCCSPFVVCESVAFNRSRKRGAYYDVNVFSLKKKKTLLQALLESLHGRFVDNPLWQCVVTLHHSKNRPFELFCRICINPVQQLFVVSTGQTTTCSCRNLNVNNCDCGSRKQCCDLIRHLSENDSI